jgi:hypothetical protein
MVGGFIIVMVFAYIAYHTIMANHDWAGVGVVGAPLVSLVAIFVIGSRSRQRERAEKLKVVDQQ